MMKITSLALSLIIFIARALAADLPEPVRDISGNILQAGVQYYVLPVFRGMGGGLTIASTRNKTCPFDVVQESLEVLSGKPVTFTPVDPEGGVIRLSTNLNIKFPDLITVCIQSLVWRLQRELNSTWFVSTNGDEGNPGLQTISNWFKIEKFDDDEFDDYKFVFCPTELIPEGREIGVICSDIGTYIDEDERRHLALGDGLTPFPFKVRFKRADEEEEATHKEETSDDVIRTVV